MGMQITKNPQTDSGIPEPKMGINTSPYQNGDPRIGLGIFQSLTRSSLGFVPIWGPTELFPKLERHSKRGPHIGTRAESVWVGICQKIKLGSPRTSLGFILIWGPTYTFVWFFNVNYAVKSTCQYVHIFEMNLLEYHTGHKVPVKICMKIIIRWCTVPVEICAALLFMWRCRFFWQLLAPFTCAAPPSNHHQSCNHNTHICSTAHLNQTSSSHYTPITSPLSLVVASTLSSTHRVI